MLQLYKTQAAQTFLMNVKYYQSFSFAFVQNCCLHYKLNLGNFSKISYMS